MEANLNSNIQNFGKATPVEKRHFGIFKDIVLTVGKVREREKNSGGSSFVIIVLYWKCCEHLDKFLI